MFKNNVFFGLKTRSTSTQYKKNIFKLWLGLLKELNTSYDLFKLYSFKTELGKNN